MVMHPFDYVVSETERQSGTMREALGMYQAYQYLLERLVPHGWRLVEGDMQVLQKMIKNSTGEYRSTAVTFNQMTNQPMPANLVPHAMKRWGEQMNSKPFIDDQREYADYMAREFLVIHPFSDGNGRVASLVWNYLMNTMHDPQPMPYFFGKE